ncbi:MAG TPA: hypothetical protein PKD09_02425 [Aggregatilinea sp.]|uniref:hypothetical protein n=1 Tax=Aggregatilinea sp. TaxID=2806333 RepID=UPI002C288E50|nr:hypothetical protein [Aggregatilinea sp.]HML20474.1 hypothetical protein [Aggregatilinea sp.]
MSDLSGEQDSVVAEAEESSSRQFPLWLALVIGVAALALAALVLVSVVPTLYDLVFPLKAPLPEGVEEVEHAKPEHDAEYWIYRTSMSGPDVAAFFEEQGSECQYMATLGESSFDTSSGVRTVAHCLGTKKSGEQTVSWEVYIADGYPDDQGPTRFRFYKYSLN